MRYWYAIGIDAKGGHTWGSIKVKSRAEALIFFGKMMSVHVIFTESEWAEAWNKIHPLKMSKRR